MAAGAAAGHSADSAGDDGPAGPPGAPGPAGRSGPSGQEVRPRTPWHLWLMGVVGLLLYAIAARDLVETARMSESYFAERGYGPAQVEYFTDYPVALRVLWTIQVVSGTAAAVLLMLRRRWADPLGLVAVVAQLVMVAVTFGAMERWQTLGPRLALTDLIITVWMVGFWLHARHHRRIGVLG